jgi:signal-transduction protein with cAMP-binding, CBS, and nucleotidyltransferase domain
MKKMIRSNVRHLLVREKTSGVMVGMISVKDIVKCAIVKHDAVVQKLTGMVVLADHIKNDF